MQTEPISRITNEQKDSALHYEESLVSSNLNSSLLRFHCAHPNVDKYVNSFVHEIIVILLAVLCSSNECVCMYLCM